MTWRKIQSSLKPMQSLTLIFVCCRSILKTYPQTNLSSCGVLADTSVQLDILGCFLLPDLRISWYHSRKLFLMPLGNAQSIMPVSVESLSELIFKCCAASWGSGITGLSKFESVVYAVPLALKNQTLYEAPPMFLCPLLLQPHQSELL